LSDQPAEDQTSKDDVEQTSLRDRAAILFAALGVLGIVRVLVGLLGAGGFVVGVILAWHATSATTLLIVSAVLLLVAALGIEWDEVIASWGSASLALKRQRAVDELEQIAESEDVPEPAREKLLAQVDELRAANAQAALRPSWRRTSNLRLPVWEALWRSAIGASHHFGDESVELTLRSVRLQGGYRCSVTTPDDEVFDAVTRQPFLFTVLPIEAYRVVYPDDFRGSEPLQPGSYEVEWYATSIPPSDASPLAVALIRGGTDRPVARDSFTFPREPEEGEADENEP
jgi:hypothetical protein